MSDKKIHELCAQCCKEIGLKWVVAMDKKWHSYCFCCDQCKMPIDSRKSFFFEKGIRTCVDCAKKEDPTIGETKVCGGCNTKIDKQWVIGLGEKWHPECFKCMDCARIIDPKETFYKENDGDKYSPKCVDCKVSNQMKEMDIKEKRCGGCTEEIKNAWVVALDEFWHHGCFKCSHCEREIDTKESFHTNLGKPICMGCNNDHFRKKCKVCGIPIAGTSLIYKENAYHHSCVNCFICGEALKEGDHENIRIVNGKDFKHVDCI